MKEKWRTNRIFKGLPFVQTIKVDTYKSYPLSTLLKRPYKKWVVYVQRDQSYFSSTQIQMATEVLR